MWVKLDDHFPDHRKLAELGDYAPLCGWLYVCGLAFCNRQLTDGRIPKAHIHRLTSFRHVSVETAAVGPRDAPLATFGDDIAVEELAEMLVSVRLWEDDGDAYAIHDYGEYQPSRAEVERLEKQRKEGGKKGAQSRWGRRGVDEPTLKEDSSAHGSTHSSTHGSTYSKTIAQRCPVPVPDPDPDPDPDPGSRTPPDGGGVRVVGASEGVEVRSLPATKDPDRNFARFWGAFPRKEGKGKAREVWRKLRPSSTLTDIMLAAIETQRASPQWRKEHGQFIPHPATWLRQARWEDSVTQEASEEYPICERCGKPLVPYQHSVQECERVWLERQRAERDRAKRGVA